MANKEFPKEVPKYDLVFNVSVGSAVGAFELLEHIFVKDGEYLYPTYASAELRVWYKQEEEEGGEGDDGEGDEGDEELFVEEEDTSVIADLLKWQLQKCPMMNHYFFDSKAQR